MARAKPLPANTPSATRKPLLDQLVAGAALFQAARYADAEARFERARRNAHAIPDRYVEARAIANIGGCRFALHQYKSALNAFLDARKVAAANGDSIATAAVDANLASLYSEMGEQDAAVAWLEQSLAAWKGEQRTRHLPQLQFEMAALRARQHRIPEAVELFRNGIAAAARKDDTALVAVGCNKLGEELLRAGRIEAAEGPLLQAYYLRKLNRLPLEASLTNLGKLRLAQGDLTSASALLDQGLAGSLRSTAAMPTWDVYLARGELHLAQERYADALADLRVAVRMARAWRWSLPAGDAGQIGAEGILDRIYSGLVDAANRLYLRTGDPELIRESFEASEENRASSLRMLVRDRQEEASEFPAVYWEALARLQKAEVISLRGGNRDALDTARAEWIRVEASAAPDLAPLPAESVGHLRGSLDPSTAMISIRLGVSASWLWALDREGLSLYRLPPRTEIERLAAEFRRDTRENRLASDAPLRLYRGLFAQLAPRFRASERWLLALDPGLIGIPLAALQVQREPRRVFLVERHVLQTIPGAAFWLENGGPRASDVSGLFVGIGDPIYNTADTRLARNPAPRRTAGWTLFADVRPPDPTLALPRLVGSGSEVERCAREWKGESLLLRGRDVSGNTVREALRRNPAVMHFSLHFLESPQTRQHALMALGLGPDYQPEMISPVEISHWRIGQGLVVLSGCESASGEALPGTGLMGLTRAWLTAGARSVLASRWATPDEDGDLFAAFYGEYRSGRQADAAGSLSRAQRRMIQEGGWRARPSFWGAWFVMGS
jgi:CHAT domain-containing protein